MIQCGVLSPWNQLAPIFGCVDISVGKSGSVCAFGIYLGLCVTFGIVPSYRKAHSGLCR